MWRSSCEFGRFNHWNDLLMLRIWDDEIGIALPKNTVKSVVKGFEVVLDWLSKSLKIIYVCFRKVLMFCNEDWYLMVYKNMRFSLWSYFTFHCHCEIEDCWIPILILSTSETERSETYKERGRTRVGIWYLCGGEELLEHTWVGLLGHVGKEKSVADLTMRWLLTSVV